MSRAWEIVFVVRSYVHFCCTVAKEVQKNTVAKKVQKKIQLQRKYKKKHSCKESTKKHDCKESTKKTQLQRKYKKTQLLKAPHINIFNSMEFRLWALGFMEFFTKQNHLTVNKILLTRDHSLNSMELNIYISNIYSANIIIIALS